MNWKILCALNRKGRMNVLIVIVDKVVSGGEVVV